MSELRKTLWLDASPEIVFQYFTDADKMALWCGRSAEVEPEPGGVYRLDLGEAGRMNGRFLRVEAPSFVSFEVFPPSGVDTPPSVIEVSITPEAGGSRVDVRQTGLESPFDTIAGHGWDNHLARLAVVATGGAPGPDPLCERSMESLAEPPARPSSAELARGWIEAWKRFDIDWLRARLAPDFVHVSPFGRFDDRDTYLAAIEPMARKSVTELSIGDIVASGDQAVIRFENRTRRGAVDSCDWVRVEDGTIREIRSFYDSTKVREILSPEEQESLDGSA